MVREEFPEEGELLLCTVQNVKTFGAFVSLDEYDGKEGFIHITEVASGWIKYIRDHVREGQKIVCKVLRVDPSKGHVDLSLKQVNEHQRRETIQRWKNEQKAMKLLGFVAERIDVPLEKSQEDFGNDLIEKFGTLYKAFEEACVDEKALEQEGFKGEWIKAFVQVAKDNIVPPFVQIDGSLELTCFAPDGIEHIKQSLLLIEEEGSTSVKVQYVGAPKYRIVVRATDYKTAEDVLAKVTETAIENIQKCGGEGKFSRE